MHELTTKPTVLWFRARHYGWGWVPITWQGWGITAMYVFWLVSQIVFVYNHTHSISDFLIQTLPTIFIMWVFFVIICFATGDSPAWYWGRKIDAKLDVLDEDGNRTGVVATRSEVHEKGLWHRAAHVYFVNDAGEVLLQRRSTSNTFRPGRWYLTAGGHLHAGDTAVETAARQISQELGLAIDPADFTKAGMITKKNILVYGTYINNEFDDIFVVHRNVDIGKIKKADENTQFAWFPKDEFKEFLAGHDPNFVHYEGTTVLFDYLDRHAGKN